jgi:26S proteasome regulatory subunit N12
LFLDSEGAVIQFAQSRGWVIKDGRIYFPIQQEGILTDGEGERELNGTTIKNMLDFARDLETIV